MIQKKYRIGDKVLLRDDIHYSNFIRNRLKETNYRVTVDDDIITTWKEPFSGNK